jgi:hypothetical protein
MSAAFVARAGRGGGARSIGDVVSGATTKLRRTFQPVRRNSYQVGERERRMWRPFDPREKGPRMKAAEHFDRSQRQPGSRNGPLGHIGLEVLRALYNLVDYKTGRLEPSIDYLVRRIKRARASVVRALAALKRHGFLDWIRRTEPTENGGQGPQVRQISNAYCFGLPDAARDFVRGLLGKAPPPDDDSLRRASDAETFDTMLGSLPLAEEMHARVESSALADALARLGEAVASSDASSLKSQNPGREVK